MRKSDRVLLVWLLVLAVVVAVELRFDPAYRRSNAPGEYHPLPR